MSIDSKYEECLDDVEEALNYAKGHMHLRDWEAARNSLILAHEALGKLIYGRGEKGLEDK